MDEGATEFQFSVRAIKDGMNHGYGLGFGELHPPAGGGAGEVKRANADWAPSEEATLGNLLAADRYNLELEIAVRMSEGNWRRATVPVLVSGLSPEAEKLPWLDAVNGSAFVIVEDEDRPYTYRIVSTWAK